MSLAGEFVVAVLAGFGVLGLAWALFGWLLPVCRDGWLICPGRKECISLVWLCLWLRGIGLVRCSLIVVDLGLSPPEQCRLAARGVEICGLSQLADRLGMGAETT